jgi:Mn2+/Fe2+ NRAMP family transporter
MTTQLSTKFTALAVALIVNCAMIGGVAYLFSGQIHDTASAQALAHELALVKQPAA